MTKKKKMKSIDVNEILRTPLQTFFFKFILVDEISECLSNDVEEGEEADSVRYGTEHEVIQRTFLRIDPKTCRSFVVLDDESYLVRYLRSRTNSMSIIVEIVSCFAFFFSLYSYYFDFY